MEIVKVFGREALAKVYLGRMENGEMIEFVESVQPPVPRDEKWVLIISTLYGCPVKCKMCDASGQYKGKLKPKHMLEQIDFLIASRFLNRKVPIPKFKIQFARMGEPSFNKGVLTVLRRLPFIYDAPGLLPCISTIAPFGTEAFFEELIEIKNELYPFGFFQLQFSLHSTQAAKRNYLMPIKKWNLKQIADYGKRFYQEGDRKVGINFAVAENFPVDAAMIAKRFNPEYFVVKLTPLNPTYTGERFKLKSLFKEEDEKARELAAGIEKYGFEVLISIGELEENRIGSNCGQYLSRYLDKMRTEDRSQKTETTTRKVA